MQAMEVARKLAELGQSKEACQAYKLALNDGDNTDRMEAAIYILQFGGVDDYKIAYSCFVDLYKQGFAQQDILAIMDGAFYQPNVKMLKKRYEKNCNLLRKYPYIFRKDFPAFNELPIIFFPYDDNQYMPFNAIEQCFIDFYNPKHQVISRNFFKDLEKPILAADVFSQYELEYLNDNVRKSEWVARENHIYLHYESWLVFCAYLQCLDLRQIIKDRKVVFLIEDEIEQYPIDFKERFGIDYSQCKVESLHIREINRLIWHTQLSTHNGGDFFNEIFDAHPNLLCMPSIMFDNTLELIDNWKKAVDDFNTIECSEQIKLWRRNPIVKELICLYDRSDKDIFVAIFLRDIEHTSPFLNCTSRILPAIFFQPHFPNMEYKLDINDFNGIKLYSEQYEQIKKSTIFSDFKYIKTFTPMRRITSSYGAAVKFMYKKQQEKQISTKVLGDVLLSRVLNRSFMIDWQNRFFKDSVLVRFEDGKLNPKATFTALAAFLDLPYTESMTYCSLSGERNPESLEGNDIGFSVAAIYRTNDEFANNSERAFIEFFMRDAYEYYGYDFKYYDGSEIGEERLLEWLNNFTVIDGFMRNTRKKLFESAAADSLKNEVNSTETSEQLATLLMEKYMNKVYENRYNIAKILMRGLNFVNKNGQPLHMMPLLKLDPELLEQPLYR